MFVLAGMVHFTITAALWKASSIESTAEGSCHPRRLPLQVCGSHHTPVTCQFKFATCNGSSTSLTRMLLLPQGRHMQVGVKLHMNSTNLRILMQQSWALGYFTFLLTWSAEVGPVMGCGQWS